MDGARIYISGPITGVEAYHSRFDKAEKEIKRLDNTYIPINPAKLGMMFGESFEYGEYMQLDLQMLSMCDGIYMLDGWENSRGAKIELEMAKARNMMIFYQDYNQSRDIRVPNFTSFKDIYASFRANA